MLAKVVPSTTSIRLVVSNPNIDPELITGILGVTRSRNELCSDKKTNSRKSFPCWELPVDNLQSAEQLLLWTALLEKVHLKLKTLSDEDIGAYLDVRVCEDNLYIENELLSRLGTTGTELSVWFNPPEQTIWNEPDSATTITFPCPNFNCQLDEDHFFQWLKQIEGVKDVRGHLTELTVYLSVLHLADYALRDFIGLFYRYNIEPGVLQSQLTPQNELWFKHPDSYWYTNIFGQ